jgi:hypothetical protein
MEKESRLEYPVFLSAADKQASRAGAIFIFFRCLKEEGRREGQEEQSIKKVSRGEVGEGRKEEEHDERTYART